MILASFFRNFQKREKKEDDSEDGHQDDEQRQEDEQAHLLSVQQKPQEEEKNDQDAAGGVRVDMVLPSSTLPSDSLPLPALSGISLEVKPGELVCVYGPTGCGKSTLLLSLLGEVRRVEGTVEVRKDDGIMKP